MIPTLQDAKGNSCSTITGAALCRCGGSINRPFCDGTHGKIVTTDENLADRKLDKRDNHVGRKITIHDNRSICAHAGHCTDDLSSVFRMDEEPWIDADGATVEQIITAISQCPSGAHSYSVNYIEHRGHDQTPMVTATKDGPYAITGGIELVDQRMAEGASKEHYTLCRCGASKNKPFCDGTHWQIRFNDDRN